MCNLMLLLTLDIRPSVVLLLCIVLIQLLAAKPNIPIIIIHPCSTVFTLIAHNRKKPAVHRFRTTSSSVTETLRDIPII